MEWFWGGILVLSIVISIVTSIMENWDKIVEFFARLLMFAIVISVVGGILFAIGDEFGAGGVILTIVGSIVVFYVGVWYMAIYRAWDINHEIKIKEKRRKKADERKILGNTKRRYLNESNINDSIKIVNNGKFLETRILLILTKNGLDINTQDMNGQTALHKLMQSNQTKAIMTLLNQGARLDIKNKNNKTAMESALPEMKEYFSPFSIVMRNEMELLWNMRQAGMDINLKNAKGQTALHALALKYGYIKDNSKSLKSLIDAGIDINSLDNYGRSPLFYAVIHSIVMATESLLKYEPLIDIEDKEGKSPLAYAKIYENKELISLLKKHSKKYQKRFWFILLSTIAIIATLLFAFIKLPSSFKNDLFSYSVSHGDFDMAHVLSQYGAEDPKISIMDMILNNENMNTIMYQLENKNIDINKQDKNGKTILHYAYGHSEIGIIQEFIKYGADESLKDNKGRRPCFYAIYNTHQDVESCDTIIMKDKL